MTVENEDQLEKLRTVGRLVARTLVATRQGPVILTLAQGWWR